MPILSLNFGISSTRGVHLNDAGELTSYVYRYPYCRDLYIHSYSESEFYSEVVEYIIKQLKVKKGECDILATGFPATPDIGKKFASNMVFDQLVKKIDNYDLISITDSSVFTQNNFSTPYDIEKLQYGPNEKNYLLNLALYKNTFPEKPSEYNLLMANIWNMFEAMRKDSTSVMLSNRPTLFMGDIFDTTNIEFHKISYLYLLSFIVNPGIFQIALDRHSDFIHLTHLRHYNSKKFSTYYDNFMPENIGTLINSPGDTSCLIKTESGNDQLLEVKSGRLIFVPIGDKRTTRVMVKSKLLGNIEKTVGGGKLGLVIDTRTKLDSASYDYNQLQVDINSNLKGITEILRRI